MTVKFKRVFGNIKPVIAMVHLNALPGSPLYDARAGVDGILAGARKDLKALQDAGVDAIMFGNENDRPYELSVDMAHCVICEVLAAVAIVLVMYGVAVGDGVMMTLEYTLVASVIWTLPIHVLRSLFPCRKEYEYQFALLVGDW